MLACPPTQVLRVAHIVPVTEAEGPGRRFALWFQGCPLRCPECCNPEMLPFVGGTGRSGHDVLAEIEQAHRTDGIEGITLLGGEPLAHAAGAAVLARETRSLGLTVMVFTGYTLEQARELPDPAVADLLGHTDILVDGPYIRELPDTRRRWIGSTNQRIHFLTDRYRADDPCWRQSNTLEIRLRGRRIVGQWLSRPVGGRIVEAGLVLRPLSFVLCKTPRGAATDVVVSQPGTSRKGQRTKDNVVSAFEGRLLCILHAILGHAPPDQALPLVLERMPAADDLEPNVRRTGRGQSGERMHDVSGSGRRLAAGAVSPRRPAARRPALGAMESGRTWVGVLTQSLEFLIWITAHRPGRPDASVGLAARSIDAGGPTAHIPGLRLAP